MPKTPAIRDEVLAKLARTPVTIEDFCNAHQFHIDSTQLNIERQERKIEKLIRENERLKQGGK